MGDEEMDREKGGVFIAVSIKFSIGGQNLYLKIMQSKLAHHF